MTAPRLRFVDVPPRLVEGGPAGVRIYDETDEGMVVVQTRYERLHHGEEWTITVAPHAVVQAAEDVGVPVDWPSHPSARSVVYRDRLQVIRVVRRKEPDSALERLFVVGDG